MTRKIQTQPGLSKKLTVLSDLSYRLLNGIKMPIFLLTFKHNLVPICLKTFPVKEICLHMYMHCLRRYVLHIVVLYEKEFWFSIYWSIIYANILASMFNSSIHMYSDRCVLTEVFEKMYSDRSILTDIFMIDVFGPMHVCMQAYLYRTLTSPSTPS